MKKTKHEERRKGEETNEEGGREREREREEIKSEGFFKSNTMKSHK